MIFDKLTNADRYVSLHSLFPRAIEYLRGTVLSDLPPGRYSIIGDDLFVIVEYVSARVRAEAQLECHRRYIDIQLVLEGMDEMGWKPLADCYDPVSDYSVERDIQFFHDVPAAWITTPPEHLCIFFPEDAHAPLVGTGYIRKVVVKIAVSATA